MKKITKRQIFVWVLALAPLVLIAAAYSRLPDRVPMQWDFGGKVGYEPKWHLWITAGLAPLFALKGAELGGSDDAGSVKVEEVTGKEYEPSFTPVLEQIIGGELPGEVESLFFCIQTGLGVGVLAFGFGYLVARKKYGGMQQEKPSDQEETP